MLKSRIIPVLLTDGNGQCVKPVAFERPYRKLGTMEQYIRVIESRNVDELIIIDINATQENREPNFAKLRSWCDNLFCPVTYGGGIRTLDHIRLALENGADKVAIQVGGFINPSFITHAASKFGSQAIVSVINTRYLDDINWVCINRDITDGGGFSAWSYAKELEMLRAGELLITDVDRDGSMDGYNLSLIEEVSQSVSIPIVALGGCGDPIHMHQALAAGASAVAVGSMFLYTDHTPKSCAEFLSKIGDAVRI